MSAEKSGFNITVTCSQDPTINFACRAKKRPGIKLGEKIDMTTDASIGSKEFEPGNLFEITDGQLTVLDDPENAAKIIAILGKKGTVTFQGKVTKTSVKYTNAWFASYVPDETKIDNVPPTATIVIQSTGTLPEL